MFTGLVEETGEILKVEEGPFLRVYIGARKVLEDLKVHKEYLVQHRVHYYFVMVQIRHRHIHSPRIPIRVCIE